MRTLLRVAVIGALLLPVILAAQTDFAPHDLTSGTSHSPYRLSASSADGVFWDYWMTLDEDYETAYWRGNLNGVDWQWLDLDTINGVIEVPPYLHDFTSNNSHSPFVVSASSYEAGFGGFPPWQALDNGFTIAQMWLGTGGGVDWWKLDLGSGQAKIIEAYRIMVNSLPQPTRAPKTWTLQGSNDDAAWTTIDTVASETGWGAGETRTFLCDDVSTAYRYLKLDFTANNGDATYTQLLEVYFYSKAGVSAIRKKLGTYAIKSYAVDATRAPKNWTVQGTNDWRTWDTLDTVTNETAWGTHELRTYTADVVTTAYQAIKLDITANNGHVTYTEVEELYLYELSSDIKSVSTVVQASIKKISGAAIASVKRLAGVANQ